MRYWTSIACVAMGSTGLSAVIGSWNTMAMRSPRSRRSSPGARVRTSRPSNRICPPRISALSASSLMTAETRVVLPQPLADQAHDLAARHHQIDLAQRWTRPRGVWKSTDRPRTSSSRSMVAQSRRSLGSNTSRSVSPRKVKPSVLSTSGMPAAMTSHGVLRMKHSHRSGCCPRTASAGAHRGRERTGRPRS